MFGEVAFERIEACRPEPLVMGEPTLRLLHRGGVETTGHRTPDLLPLNQSRVREDIEVFEHRGK
jgi:hypothetical protein